MARRNREAEIPAAQRALDNLKYEIATEVGIPNYASVDKGTLTSRQNGQVGGNMVRKMIQFAEQNLANGGINSVANAGTMANQVGTTEKYLQ